MTSGTIMDGSQKDAEWKRLFGLLLGYQATWIADIGLKAGLFREIADAESPGMSADALAEKLAFAPRYVRVWARAAYAYGLLDWDASRGYRLSPEMKTLLLDPSDPRFMGGRIQFVAALHEDFRAFPRLLKTGEPWARAEHDAWLLEALKNATKPDVSMITEAVLPQAGDVLARLEGGGTMLDVGSGAGFALAHYARRFPASRVVGLEPDPSSIELARKTVAEAGLADRVEIRLGDANRLEEADRYDLVTMNVTLHETGGPEDWANVLRRVHRALKAGGTLLVSELPYPDEETAYREEPIYQMLAGVQLHEAVVGCGMIRMGELRGLVEKAGFEKVRVADQPLPTRFVVLGRKP